MDATAERLVGFAQRAARAALPGEVMHECKRRVLDSVACALAGRATAIGKLACRTASRYVGEQNATVWGTRTHSSVEMASFANGTLLRCLDMSDMYRTKSGGHPSDVIAPIISVAESVGASGGAALNAIAIAYDIYCGFCDGIDANSMGWDQPVYGIVAAALGVSAVLKLNSVQMKHALSLALVPNMALYQTRTGELSAWKGCAAANGSRNAVFAALLAREGYTGPEQPIEGAMGLRKVIGHFDWDVTGADSRQAVCRTHFKCFPICYHGQAAVWAALDLRTHGIPVDQIEDVQIDTYGTAVRLMGADPSRWSPTTRETADHSLPYVVAVALLQGELTEQSFQDRMLKDSTVRGLMSKIRVVDNPGLSRSYPDLVPCRLKVRMRDGDVRESNIDYPKGHDRNRMSDGDLEEKARTLLGTALDSRQSKSVIDAVWQLDKTERISHFVELLTVDS